MRFHCNRCNTDFTTLNQLKGQKFSFVHFNQRGMVCPNCKASNTAHYAKPSRKTRQRYQPKARSYDPYEESLPSVVLHELCQKRISGNPLSEKGIEIVCDGCREYLNCYTGNVDDGTIYNPAYEVDRREQADKAKAKQIEEAKKRVAEKKIVDEKEHLRKLRDKMGRVGVGVGKENGVWVMTFKGTKWKLSTADLKAIIVSGDWSTTTAIVIKKTFENQEIPITSAQRLLYLELKVGGK